MRPLAILLLCLCTLCTTAQAQDKTEEKSTLNHLLESIASRNLSLQALRAQGASTSRSYRLELLPEAVEVEMGAFNGHPSSIGRKYNLSISQSLELATLLGIKGSVVRQQEKLITRQEQQARMELLLQAKLAYLDLVYYNAHLHNLYSRLEQEETIVEAWRSKLALGDASLKEYNNVLLNLLDLRGEIKRAESERNEVQNQITEMNGGSPFAIEERSYSHSSLPPSYQEWIASAAHLHPLITLAEDEVALSRRQVTASKAALLPALKIGVMREQVMGEYHQGVTLGIAIPLWRGGASIRQAQSALQAAEARERATRQSLTLALKGAYDKTVSLQELADSYSSTLRCTDNATMLRRALDLGEISIIDYIIQSRLYYGLVDKALQAERDYHKSLAVLTAMEL